METPIPTPIQFAQEVANNNDVIIDKSEEFELLKNIEMLANQVNKIEEVDTVDNVLDQLDQAIKGHEDMVKETSEIVKSISEDMMMSHQITEPISLPDSLPSFELTCSEPVAVEPVQDDVESKLTVEEAAIRIQAAFRGFEVRKTLSREVSPIRKQDEDKEEVNLPEPSPVALEPLTVPESESVLIEAQPIVESVSISEQAAELTTEPEPIAEPEPPKLESVNKEVISAPVPIDEPLLIAEMLPEALAVEPETTVVENAVVIEQTEKPETLIEPIVEENVKVIEQTNEPESVVEPIVDVQTELEPVSVEDVQVKEPESVIEPEIAVQLESESIVQELLPVEELKLNEPQQKLTEISASERYF